MRFSAVIFDLDGVICSTDQYHFLAWKKLADQLGLFFDETVNDRLRGISRRDSLNMVLGHRAASYSFQQKEQLAQEKNAFYREFLREMTPKDVSPEVLYTLRSLRERGFKLGIGSSSQNAQEILRLIGLAHFFDAVADGTQISRSKPDPEVFLLSASLLDVAPSQTLVVEDAQAGIQAAKAGGFTVAGIGMAAHYDLTDISLASFSELCSIEKTV